MLNVCAHCTTKFAVGVEHCPQCGNADYYEEGTMAKISRHGGPSYVGEHGPEVVDLPAGGVVEPAPTEPEEAELDDAPDGPYGAMLRVDLQAELLKRGLSTSGNKGELVARLAAADASAAEAESDAEQDAEPE